MLFFIMICGGGWNCHDKKTVPTFLFVSTVIILFSCYTAVIFAIDGLAKV